MLDHLLKDISRFCWKIEVYIVNAVKRRWLDTFSSPLVWFGSATPLSDVRNLIESLKPVASRTELKRFGAARDGGYLMPDILTGVIACISPGVNMEVGFDTEIANRGIDVYMADASVDGPPASHARFHFEKKFFGIYDSSTTTTIDRFCSGISRNGDLILQMDIEGAEYGVLASASDELMGRFRIMIVEFHNMDMLFMRSSFQHMSAVFQRIMLTHKTVHIHPNNYSSVITRGGLGIPKGMEFTFVRNDFVGLSRPAPPLPHSLDQDNTLKYPPIVLPTCWTRN